MDKLQDLFAADFAESIARRRDDTNLATARQRDGAAFDNRALGYFGLEQLFRSDNPMGYADLNAASRMPTTLDHPNATIKS
ncbi:MAG: hypothetical protein NNA30_11505 [Nitrospira sp.]|nr:hypothetical protein [Nitrospira sp.]